MVELATLMEHVLARMEYLGGFAKILLGVSNLHYHFLETFYKVIRMGNQREVKQSGRKQMEKDWWGSKGAGGGVEGERKGRREEEIYEKHK